MGSKSLFLAVTVACLIAVFGLAGCSEEGPVSSAPPTPSHARITSATGTIQLEGEIGPGSVYAISVPETWNGDLVLYAHGFKDVEVPIGLPTADNWPALETGLLDQGYAIALSSFSENGLAVKDGARRTEQLRGIFVSKFGQPERTYLAGHSLGGAIAVFLAEKHPEHYAGALPMCGMIGGSQAQIDYVGNVRVLFDACYPGVLPGSVLNIPDNYDLYQDVILPLVAAIQTSPDCALAISQIQQTPVPFTNGQQLVQSFAEVIGYNFRGFADVMGRTHQHTPFDNWDTVYTGPLPQPFLDGLNASVERYRRTPDATAYLSHYFEPTGDLEIPVLTLHTQWDPIVPIFHEDLYQQAVDAKGNSDLLVQRTVLQYGHCKFGGGDSAAGAAVMLQAFDDLVNWVENGVKPTP